MSEHFVCVPLGTKLSRSSCAERHAKAGKIQRGLYATNVVLHAPSCATCPIGAAHARGEEPSAWPDGARLELVTIKPAVSSVKAALSEYQAHRVAHRRGAGMPQAMTITHDGRTQTLREWAAEVGVAPKTIGWRVTHGWTPAQALGYELPPEGRARKRSSPSHSDEAPEHTSIGTDPRYAGAIAALRERRVDLTIELAKIDDVLRTLVDLTGARA